MRHIGLIVYAICGIILSLSVAAAGEYMTEEEFRAKFVGNTVKGKDADGLIYYELVLPDGKIRGKWRNYRFAGTWCFGNDTSKKGKCQQNPLDDVASYTKLCIDYAGGSDDDGCWRIFQAEDKFYYYNDRGNVEWIETILPGNPENL